VFSFFAFLFAEKEARSYEILIKISTILNTDKKQDQDRNNLKADPKLR